MSSRPPGVLQGATAQPPGPGVLHRGDQRDHGADPPARWIQDIPQRGVPGGNGLGAAGRAVSVPRPGAVPRDGAELGTEVLFPASSGGLLQCVNQQFVVLQQQVFQTRKLLKAQMHL